MQLLQHGERGCGDCYGAAAVVDGCVGRRSAAVAAAEVSEVCWSPKEWLQQMQVHEWESLSDA